MNNLWTVKYKPENLDDMILNPKTRKRLEYIMNNVCSAILHGPTGIGKSTFVDILLLQPDQDKLCIDAAVENTITVIKKTVETYCFAGGNSNMLGQKNVIFDNADSLNKPAKDALEGLMDKKNGSVRFIFMTNKLENISDEIKSRCIDVEMKNPSQGDIIDYMKKILADENLNHNNNLNDIVRKYYPDIRRTINEFQLEVS